MYNWNLDQLTKYVQYVNQIVTTIVKNDVKPNQDSEETGSKLFSNIVSVVVSGYDGTKMIKLPQPVSLPSMHGMF